ELCNVVFSGSVVISSNDGGAVHRGLVGVGWLAQLR
ncbi:hypothetical protein LCGC14_2813970, partial [marine sediment metagenome]